MQQLYVSTSQIAKVVGIGEKWLREHKRDIFVVGIHYHYPRGFKDTRWSIASMIEWVEGREANSENDEVNSILDSLSA